MLTHLYRTASIRPCAALVLLLGLGSAGCATAPVAAPAAVSRPAREATLDEVLAAYEGYCRGLETLSASGDLDVRDLRAGKSRKVGVRVVASRGGRLYLKGSVAIVTALEVVSNGERFWFQVPSKKTVWTGSVAAPPRVESDDAPYYALRPGDVTLALLPEPLAPEEADSVLFESDRQSFSLCLARVVDGRGTVRRRVWVSRDTLLPSRLRTYDGHGDIQTEVTLGGWREGAATRIVVSRPAQGYVASFTLDKVQTNVAVPEKAFVPRTPEGYKVVEVDE